MLAPLDYHGELPTILIDIEISVSTTSKNSGSRKIDNDTIRMCIWNVTTNKIIDVSNIEDANLFRYTCPLGTYPEIIIIDENKKFIKEIELYSFSDNNNKGCIHAIYRANIYNEYVEKN